MHRHLPYQRSDRIAARLFELFSKALLTEISDPRLQDVTIVDVRITSDLSMVRVNYTFSPFSEERKKEIDKACQRAQGFFKNIIRKNVVLKIVPKIEFYYNIGFSAEERISELLNGDKNAL